MKEKQQCKQNESAVQDREKSGNMEERFEDKNMLLFFFFSLLLFRLKKKYIIRPVFFQHIISTRRERERIKSSRQKSSCLSREHR